MQTNILLRAKRRADAYNVRNVIVPCVSGFTARAAREVFDENYHIFAVGNPTSSHSKGWVYHAGTSEKQQRELEDLGITVILQDVSLFQAGSDKGAGIDQMHAFGQAYTQRTHKAIDAEMLTCLTNELLTFWFSDGPRVCIELALMAADSGLLPLDQDCISLAVPSRYCELPDAAVILRPARTENAFGGSHEPELRIKDILLVPSPGDWWMQLPERA